MCSLTPFKEKVGGGHYYRSGIGPDSQESLQPFKASALFTGDGRDRQMPGLRSSQAHRRRKHKETVRPLRGPEVSGSIGQILPGRSERLAFRCFPQKSKGTAGGRYTGSAREPLLPQESVARTASP